MAALGLCLHLKMILRWSTSSVLDQVLIYKVYNILEIEPSDVDVLLIEDNRDLCTLVTCTPYGINTHRLLVMGERIPADVVEVDSDGNIIIEDHKMIIDPAICVFIGFILFIMIIFIITLINNIRYKHKKLKEREGSGWRKNISL